MKNMNIFDLLLTNSLEEKSYFNVSDFNVGLEDSEIDDWLLEQLAVKLKKDLSEIPDKTNKITYLNNFIKEKNEQFIFKKSFNENDGTPYIKLGINELFTSPISSRFHKEFLIHPSSVDIISPFISGGMLNQLNNHINNDPELKIRIITTTYDGSSNLESIKKIKMLINKFPDNFEAVLENSFYDNNERLHAKSYDFKRSNGFGTLYVGSSNFTKTGIYTGKEYNVKISEFSEKRIYDQQQLEFNNLFFSNNYLNFKNDSNKIDEIIEKMNLNKLEKERINEEYLKVINEKSNDVSKKIFKPFDYQLDAIKSIEEENKIQKNKHLLVMATGTGKTVVVSFYLKKLKDLYGKDLKILFIAPRKEILEQTKNTFKNIMGIKEEQFANLYDSNIRIDSFKPNNYSIFLATSNTLKGKFLDKISSVKFDCVIFDEAHHMEAKSIKNIFEVVEHTSKEILGITATPQRMDGIDVSSFFGDSYTYELRLFDAIQLNILSAFDYYFIEDDSIEEIDFDISLEKKLSSVLSSSKRNKFVYEKIIEYIGEKNTQVKTIIFCASIEHAKSVSDYLNYMGECAGYITSQVWSEIEEKKVGLKNEERKEIKDKFEKGIINYLCTVDILNEGVDIPQIDHIIFLRPTNSSIVYIQQLGRGLRKVLDKKLQVFDFVNNINISKNTTYNPLGFLRSINPNISLGRIINNIESINDYFPDEVSFNFTKISGERIIKYLKNLESGVPFNAKKLNNYKNNLKNNTYIKLRDYLNATKVQITKLYSNSSINDLSDVEQEQLLKFSILNVEWIIKEIYSALKLRVPSKNDYINMIMSDIYFSKKTLFHWDTIFDNKNMLDELLALLKYKLNFESENLLKNETNNLIGMKMSLTTAQNLFLKKEVKTNFMKSVSKFENDKTMIIKTSESIEENSNGYINSYDYKESQLRWSADSDWKIKNYTVSQKFFLDEKNTIKFLFRSLEDQKMFGGTLKGEKIFTYIGDKESVTGVFEYQNKIKEQNNVYYVITIKQNK